MNRALLLDRYADLIVTHGLNIQPGQDLQIAAEVLHRDLVGRILRAAYARGARYVDVTLSDPHLARARLEGSRPEDLDHVPRYVTEKYRDVVDQHSANLRLVGSEEPDILADLDTRRVNRVRQAQHRAIRYFFDEGIGKSRVHWTVAAAATPGWARKVFPKLAPEAAETALWEQIFRICRVDHDDYAERWARHDAALHERAARLDAMQIDELHFTGPGTDLRVGLSERAHFLGGSDIGARGVAFEPNLPTEEVFTTPDARRTEGTVRATRPFFINGQLIDGLEMTFRDGTMADFRARQGAEAFTTYIDNDPGARRLGEVALVGVDSPVFQSGLVFQEILFDENAACHIAVGMAYKTALHGGGDLSQEELQAIGCNESTVHTDMMISDAHVDVSARTRAGAMVPLLRRGAWVLG